MKRRTILQSAVACAFGSKLMMAFDKNQFDLAAKALEDSVVSGQVAAAALFVQQRETVFTGQFGEAKNEDAIFLLASISKPITVAAIMTLYDQQLFALDDPVRKFMPQFSSEGRERITMRQLFTHCSGLPDQLPENTQLRVRHAELTKFVEGAMRTPLLFTPGAKYSYSSMGILLASAVAEHISGKSIATLVDEVVYQPLGMKHSALGLGRLDMRSLMRCQVMDAAPESGAGDAAAKDWDWNSEYWRKLGSPWGGAHGSAKDVARFLSSFLAPQGEFLQPETARLVIKNHNPPHLRPRGLGFDLGAGLHGPPGNPEVFGHTGSTGTLCWADPKSNSICVVLTTLPATAASPHPRESVSEMIARSVV